MGLSQSMLTQEAHRGYAIALTLLSYPNRGNFLHSRGLVGRRKGSGGNKSNSQLSPLSSPWSVRVTASVPSQVFVEAPKTES